MTSAGEMNDAILFSTLSILQLIKNAQQQHGLRHGDYQRYRGYCRRRLQRVRKALHITHSHKPKAGFQAKALSPALIKDERYLIIPLFEAERCWAYAMQLKQEANTEPRKNFHLINRLHKAVKHSAALEGFAKSIELIDARTKLEAQAYNSWMHGCLNFELQQWAKAAEYFTQSQNIYEKLATVVHDDEQIELFRSRIQEMAPQLRYCHYSIGDASAASDLVDMHFAKEGGEPGELETLIAEARAAQELAKAKEIEWCEQKFTLELPPAVSAFFASLDGFHQRISTETDVEARNNLYERIVMDCRDAIQNLKDTKGENLKMKKSRGGPDLEEEGQLPSSQVQLLLAYLNYIRLTITVERSLETIQRMQASTGKSEESTGGDVKKVKPQDLVRLYDSVLQNLAEMESILPQNRAAGIIRANLAMKTIYWKCFRCASVADCFMGMGKWQEAYALCQKTAAYAKEIDAWLTDGRQQRKDLPFARYVSRKQADQLLETISKTKYAAYAHYLAHTETDLAGGSGTAAASGDKASESADISKYKRVSAEDFAAGKIPNLAKLPIDFASIPCKPLFFDVALNHITFPSFDEKLETGKVADGTAAGGLRGMVKGWFWGSKN